MRLPRRVPWASLAELDQVCSWIYADENDLDAKVRAINRVSKTKLPHLVAKFEQSMFLPGGCMEAHNDDTACARLSAVHLVCDRARRVGTGFIVFFIIATSICLGHCTIGQRTGRSAPAWSVCKVHCEHRCPAGVTCVVSRAPTCCHARGLAQPRSPS